MKEDYCGKRGRKSTPKGRSKAPNKTQRGPPRGTRERQTQSIHNQLACLAAQRPTMYFAQCFAPVGGCGGSSTAMVPCPVKRVLRPETITSSVASAEHWVDQ
eukprot:1532048-Amphidinium_carterae.1